MKIDAAYLARLLAGDAEGAIGDLAQLAAFWSVRAHVTEQGKLEGLSHSEAAVHLMMVYTGEVGNGGHLQYFANASGALAHETLEALRELRESELAEALHAAMDVFPAARVPKDRSARVDCPKASTTISCSASTTWITRCGPISRPWTSARSLTCGRTAMMS